MTPIIFDEATHTYTVGARVLPSVTRILDPLKADMSAIPPLVLENARRRGVAVDRAVDLYENDRLDVASMSDEVATYFSGFLKFIKDYQWLTMASQRVVRGPGDEYAGTLDLIGECKLGQVILDVKCTYKTPPSVHAQVAGYRRGIAQDPVLADWKTGAGLCLRLCKDGSYDVTPIDFDAGDRLFSSCLNIWRFHHG